MLIVLDYVCDLEATILVVSSKHHVKDEKSYGKGNNYSPAGYGNGGQQQYDQQQYGNGGQQQYDQQQYGGNQGGYGNGGQQYDQQQYGGNQGGYGKPSNGYGDRSSYKDKPHYVRKITRQYCRYAAAWSEKACKFCCKVVARSAYTNPVSFFITYNYCADVQDDIIAAIFSFDPAHPGSGGAGVEKYGHKDEKYGHKDKYQSNEYGGQGGYENQVFIFYIFFTVIYT